MHVLSPELIEKLKIQARQSTLYDQIVQIIQENGECVSGYGLVLDGAHTVAQLIMNLLIETGRSMPNE